MARRAVVLSVDGLSTSSLAPYGCSWQPTPATNELSACSFVFDHCIADTARSQQVLTSLLSGTHAVQRSSDAVAATNSNWSAPSRSVFVTDDSRLIDAVPDSQFSEQIVVPYEVPQTRCEEVEQTALSNLFASAIEVAEQGAGVCWIHSTSLARCWDAPRGLIYCDEDDELPGLTSPPSIDDTSKFDPDEVTALMTVYGGQVRLLDMMLGILVDSIADAFSDPEFLFVLVGTSGFALGENNNFGFEQHPSASTGIHLPLIIHSASDAPLRSPQICQPHDVGSAIAHWIVGNDSPLLAACAPKGWAADDRSSQWALTVDDLSRPCALTTRTWKLRIASEITSLYLKPDDRFDVNDIAGRIRRVADLMNEQCEPALASLARQSARHELPEEILSGQW